jgi:hypothetical protein
MTARMVVKIAAATQSLLRFFVQRCASSVIVLSIVFRRSGPTPTPTDWTQRTQLNAPNSAHPV